MSKRAYPDVVLGIRIHSLLPVEIQIVLAGKARVLRVEPQHLDERRTHDGNVTAIRTDLACSKRVQDAREGDRRQKGCE